MGMHEPTAIEQARKARELREKFYGKPVVINKAALSRKELKGNTGSEIERLERLLKEAHAMAETLQANIDKALRINMTKNAEECVLSVISPILDDYGMTLEEIMWKTRSQIKMKARHAAWRAAYEQLDDLSVSDIAEVFGCHYSGLVNAAKRYGWKRRYNLVGREVKRDERGRIIG